MPSLNDLNKKQKLKTEFLPCRESFPFPEKDQNRTNTFQNCWGFSIYYFCSTSKPQNYRSPQSTKATFSCEMSEEAWAIKGS
uniref:Uncharacterized protein n=1 Tax=Rhizophora mucronata TaxID=61149 RepID=A0A2P2L9X2_RHIMU